MSEIDCLLKQLHASQNKGKLFEKLVKWYLENDPVYTKQLKKIWLWNDWIDNWGPDQGIDLVAETHDGAFWAIQAKAYAPEYSVSKKDIDKFLSESSSSKISHRVMIATTNRFHKSVYDVVSRQEKSVSILGLHALQEANVIWPASMDALMPSKILPLSPKLHQEEALKNLVNGFAQSDRGQLIMACGTGKTCIGLWLSERMNAKKILVLVPSLSLLSQTLRGWATNTSKPQLFKYLPVCCDDSVRDKDSVAMNIWEFCLPARTDHLEIKTMLQREEHIVVFATYQSSPEIARACELLPTMKFDLVIADEAHRCAGRVENDFATILDESRIPSTKRLFMTATPRIYKDQIKKMSALVEQEVASMDDHLKFGPVMHRLAFSEAIDRQLLSDYQVVIVGVDSNLYYEHIQNRQLVTTDGKGITDARSLAIHVAVLKAMRQFELRRVVSYHNSIKGAKDFSNDLLHVHSMLPEEEQLQGIIHSKYVTGEMPSGERQNHLKRLRNISNDEYALLANARCLTEGIDVPTLDGIVFVDPRSSEIDIVQAVGRAIRKAENKKQATIVLPVFINEQSASGASIEHSEYQHVWKVLNALRSHDEKLGDELDQLRRQLGKQGSSCTFKFEKIFFDLPTRIDENFVKALKLVIVENTTSTWDFNYGLLIRFFEKNGHTKVPENYVIDGSNLYSWCSTQRQKYKNNELTELQITLLNQIHSWDWHPLQSKHQKILQELKIFQKTYGHVRVPSKYRTSTNYGLGKKICYLRVQYNSGNLSQEVIAVLESFDGWSWDSTDSKWNEAFEAYNKYVSLQNTSFIDSGFMQDGIDINKWAKQQRVSYKKGCLDSEKIRRLESCSSWYWDEKDFIWKSKLKLCAEFYNEHNHLKIPTFHSVGVFTNIGKWFVEQKSLLIAGELKEERKLLFEQLPGFNIMHQRESTWEEYYEKLLAYSKETGISLVPGKGYFQGFELIKLYEWVMTQRKLYRKKRLLPNRIALLEKLPMWHWSYTGSDLIWFEKLNMARCFLSKNGHLRIPREYIEEDVKIGLWWHNQKMAFRKDMPPLRKDPLLLLLQQANENWM